MANGTKLPTTKTTAVRAQQRPAPTLCDEALELRWFTAHLLYRGELDEGDAFPVRERVVLLQAPPREALLRAERLGASLDGDRSQFPQGRGRLRFVGVRKLFEIGAQLQTDIEIGSLELEVDNEEDVDRVLEGDLVRAVLDW